VVYGHPLEIFNLDRTGAVPPSKGFPARRHLKFLRTRLGVASRGGWLW
jgi:hypothetical protein